MQIYQNKKDVSKRNSNKVKFSFKELKESRELVGQVMRGVVELGTINVFVARVSRVISAGKIDRGYAKFRHDNGNVGEETLRGLKTFSGDVSLKVAIVTLIINSVARALAVVEFFAQLMLLMSVAKFFGTENANFLLSTEQKPRLDFGKPINFDQSEATANFV